MNGSFDSEEPKEATRKAGCGQCVDSQDWGFLPPFCRGKHFQK